MLLALVLVAPAAALESDRQQPLEVNADATGGSLGDGVTVLTGNVDIRQGTLHITADRAEIEQQEGRVTTVILTGAPATLQQEIEEQGLVRAEARRIRYEVAPSLVTLTGEADVRHPQYEIQGEELVYDLTAQQFQGTGGNGNGRIRIRLDPEVAPDLGPMLGPGTADDEDSEGGDDGDDGG